MLVACGRSGNEATSDYQCEHTMLNGNLLAILITFQFLHNTDHSVYTFNFCTITVIPSVVQNPEHSFNSDPGTTISLSIVATSTVFYLWQVNNTDIFNNDKYEGARTSTLVIHNIQENDEGFYSCIFGNQYLTIASGVAVVTVCKCIPL